MAHPGTIVGLVVSIAIPFLIYLAPNIKHRDTIQQLDLNLPLPLFGVQLVAGIVLFCLLSKDFSFTTLIARFNNKLFEFS